MTPRHHVFDYARVTLEARTPHGIGTGAEDITHDMLLLRDANGLPALPGTSLAGVLRHLYARSHGETAADELFGREDGDTWEQGQASRVVVTWGLIHDSHNHPEEALREAPEDDPLLRYLLTDHPLVRQRVRLNHRGAAAATGKFDTTLVPAGARYTTFISHWSDGNDSAREAWDALLTLLATPGFRLGSGTRAGAGAFRVHEILHARWDLTDPDQRRAYCERPRRRADARGLQPWEAPKEDATRTVATLHLQAEQGWRIGGGETPLGRYDKRDPDLLPHSEPVIRWEEEQGAWSERLPVVPATAIKGALAHRTAFHYRRLTGDFAGPGTVDGGDCTAVRQLFGHANDEDGAGRPGVVIIDDAYLGKATLHAPMHNRVDRFTGGVMSGALFQEELLWQTALELRVTIDGPGASDVDAQARRAFDLALRDLARGRLPLGAAGSRGHGAFGAVDRNQPVLWSDGGAWAGITASTDEEAMA